MLQVKRNIPPLSLCSYFGEKVALYFSWLGFYTCFLLPVALLGVVAAIYGAATMSASVAATEICDDSIVGNLTMCPQCREPLCAFWKLKV